MASTYRGPITDEILAEFVRAVNEQRTHTVTCRPGSLDEVRAFALEFVRECAALEQHIGDREDETQLGLELFGRWEAMKPSEYTAAMGNPALDRLGLTTAGAVATGLLTLVGLGGIVMGRRALRPPPPNGNGNGNGNGGGTRPDRLSI